MDEFPLHLPSSGPSVKYGWWDFVPSRKPGFENRATGASIRYLGWLDSDIVPRDQDWRLFEYSDRDFSYPLAVKYNAEDRGTVHSVCADWERSAVYSWSLEVDYRISETIAEGAGRSISDNFGAYVRVDDACRSVFTVWPLTPYPGDEEARFRGLRGPLMGVKINGGWVAGAWRENVQWRRKKLTKPSSYVGEVDFNEKLLRGEKSQHGLSEHPELAPFSMISQRWTERSEPAENTPDYIRECISKNPYGWSGFMRIRDQNPEAETLVRISDKPRFLQSEDGQAVVVLGAPDDVSEVYTSAEFPAFPCRLLINRIAYGFTLTHNLRIGSAAVQDSVRPNWINGSKPEGWKHPYRSCRGFLPFGRGRAATFRSVPKFKDWPIFQRLLTDAVWFSSDKFFQNTPMMKMDAVGMGGLRRGDYTAPMIAQYDEAKFANCDDDWICGVFSTKSFAVFEQADEMMSENPLLAQT